LLSYSGVCLLEEAIAFAHWLNAFSLSAKKLERGRGPARRDVGMIDLQHGLVREERIRRDVREMSVLRRRVSATPG